MLDFAFVFQFSGEKLLLSPAFFLIWKAIKAINFPLNIAFDGFCRLCRSECSLSLLSRQVLISFLIKDYLEAGCSIAKSLKSYWSPCIFSFQFICFWQRMPCIKTVYLHIFLFSLSGHICDQPSFKMFSDYF